MLGIGLKVIVLHNMRAQALNDMIVNFLLGAALGADQMVMLARRRVLKLDAILANVKFTQQTETVKPVQGAINRCKVDRWALLLDGVIDRFGSEMLRVLAQDVEDQHTLPSEPEAARS